MTVVALGHCGPRPRDESDPRHRVLYLPDAHLIVTVECRTHNGWHCGVIARHGRDHSPGHLTLTDSDIAQADTTLAADPVHDPDMYALLWQARVRQRWLGGHMRAVARVIAEHLRPPGTLTVDIDQAAATRLVTAARLRVPGLRQLLARLTDAGMLALDPPGLDGWGTYTLCIPTSVRGLDRTVPPA
jgi:hypothetical protein